MIRELIISFDYHSGKTVKKLRELELEKKNTEDKEKLNNLKKEIEILQSDYESKLKPAMLHVTPDTNAFFASSEFLLPTKFFTPYSFLKPSASKGSF